MFKGNGSRKPNPVPFTEAQLKLMGVLEPELYDPTFQAPIECVRWLEKHEEQAEREREKARSKMLDTITLTLLKILTGLSFILFILTWAWILQ